MKLLICLGGILLLSSGSLSAQNTINTDRPDQSDGTHIVEKNCFQIETGIQFSKSGEIINSLDNVTLIRYGVTKKFEVRVLNQYSVVRENNEISGIRPFTISFKNQLCKQNGLLPKLTLVTYLRLPITVDKAFRGDHFGYTITLAGRHDLSSKIKLYSNLGVTQDQESKDISYLTALEINCTITEKFSAFIEYFGNYASHINGASGLDIGFIYAIKNNVAVDLAFGSPTLKVSIDRYVAFGLSLRLPK